MPFRTGHWTGAPDAEFVPDPGDTLPKPELRQESRKSFVLLKTFCYEVPEGGPAPGTIYVVAGEDAPAHEAEYDAGGHHFVAPPNSGGHTDLASVPWFMWWLVASYGNHTRAALLHDALIPDAGETAVVPGSTADRLLLTALRDLQVKKGGAVRHWFMWAAVSVFKTFPWWARIAAALHLVAVWAALVWIAVASWPPPLWPDTWSVGTTVLAVAVLAAALVALGVLWRISVTKRVLGPLALIPFEVVAVAGLTESRTFWPGVAAAILVPLGLLWGRLVDPALSTALWPTALIGVAVAGLPLIPILLAVALLWFVDVGAALVAAGTRKPNGELRGFEIPNPTPYRSPAG